MLQGCFDMYNAKKPVAPRERLHKITYILITFFINSRGDHKNECSNSFTLRFIPLDDLFFIFNSRLFGLTFPIICTR